MIAAHCWRLLDGCCSLLDSWMVLVRSWGLWDDYGSFMAASGWLLVIFGGFWIVVHSRMRPTQMTNEIMHVTTPH